MQLVHCTVNLAGDPRKQVRRINVSVPEIQLLKEIHGNDAVIELNYAGAREGFDELEHLKRWYGGKLEISAIIERMFPGSRPNLPLMLSDIGYGEIATDEIIEAFNKKKAAEAQAASRKKAKISAVEQRRLDALAEAQDAAEEVSELIAPPPSKKKVADPLMA